jgi:hypothetical protein
MIQRALEKRQEIDEFVQVLDVRRGETGLPREDRLSHEDWLVLEKSAKILKPIYEHSMRFQSRTQQGHHGAIWEVLPSMEMILQHLEGLKEEYTALDVPDVPDTRPPQELITDRPAADGSQAQLKHAQDSPSLRTRDEWRNGGLWGICRPLVVQEHGTVSQLILRCRLFRVLHRQIPGRLSKKPSQVPAGITFIPASTMHGANWRSPTTGQNVPVLTLGQCECIRL